MTKSTANQLRRELAGTADLMEQTIAQSDPVAGETAVSWQDAGQFVFCGAGPNYGTAMFSVAKILEASGDVAIAPAGCALAQSSHAGTLFPVAGSIRECFSPLLTSLPGALFAAYRAQLLDEPYFRAFGGGRSAEGGGGISRIRTSQRISRVNRET